MRARRLASAALVLAWWCDAAAAPLPADVPGDPRCGLQNVPHDPAEGTRVAIALFGLFRHNCTLANFARFVLDPLLHHRPEAYTVDVFLHGNVVDVIDNARSREASVPPPRRLDWIGYAPCRYTLEDQDVTDIKLGRLRRAVDESESRWRGTPIRRRRGRLYADGGASVLNLLRALYSLRASGALVEARELSLNRPYHVVASVRADVVFTREVPGDLWAFVRASPVAKLFVPHFGCAITGDLLLNDRFAVGAREAMLDAYLPRIETVTAFNASDDRAKSGLSGERHLFQTIQARGIPTARLRELCLRRVRATGELRQRVYDVNKGKLCPLEDPNLKRCDATCMENTPRCAADQGCHQRGLYISTRFFDGDAWCENPDRESPPHTCRFDHKALGFS